MKFIEREKYRHTAMANQTEVTQSRINDLPKVDFTHPPSPESADIKTFISYLQIAILILICFSVYYPILFNDFLYYWDDQWQVMNHYTEGGINFSNLWAIFTEFHGVQYSSVNETIYLFIYLIFGYKPMLFHLTSLLIHVGCVCLAYIIIIRIFNQTKYQTNINASAIAFATALLFSIHTMNVESVAWISASKIVVFTFFYLLASYTYLIYLDRKKIGFYILTIFFFVLSFGGKLIIKIERHLSNKYNFIISSITMKSSVRVYLIIFICISCHAHSQKTVESKEKGKFVIDLDNPNKSQEEVFSYSKLYKNVKAIFLETNESCLIGRIDKIQVCDQFILVLDRMIAKSLFVFDNEGRFIRKIGNIGNGPGEYISISDFTIDKENKTIFLLDKSLERIHKYELTLGKYINSIKLDQRLSSNNLEYFGGKLYADAFFYKHTDNNSLLRIIHESSEKEERHLNVMEYHKGFSNTHSSILRKSFYFRENGNLVFIQPFMDHLIEITNDSIHSLVDLKGNNCLTSGEIKKYNDAFIDMRELMMLDKYFYITSFIEKGDLIIFSMMKGRGIHTILINKKNNEFSIFLGQNDDILITDIGDYSRKMLEFGCFDDSGDGVYYFTSNSEIAFGYQELAKAGVLSPNLQGIKKFDNFIEDDNPILFYYEFKE